MIRMRDKERIFASVTGQATNENGTKWNPMKYWVVPNEKTISYIKRKPMRSTIEHNQYDYGIHFF